MNTEKDITDLNKLIGRALKSSNDLIKSLFEIGAISLNEMEELKLKSEKRRMTEDENLILSIKDFSFDKLIKKGKNIIQYKDVYRPGLTTKNELYKIKDELRDGYDYVNKFSDDAEDLKIKATLKNQINKINEIIKNK